MYFYDLVLFWFFTYTILLIYTHLYASMYLNSYSTNKHDVSWQ